LEKIEMKKTLVAVAAMAAVTGAMADASIYGTIDQAYYSTRSTSSAGLVTKQNGIYAVNNGGSAIGFKASEDIGGGMKVFFQQEIGLFTEQNGGPNNATIYTGATTTGTTTSESTASYAYENRNSFLGLSGGFGTVQVGRQYNFAFYNIIANDPMGFSALGSFTAALAGNPNRTDQMVAYTLPSFVPGLNVQLGKAYGNTETGTGATGANTFKTGDSTSWALNYSTNGLYIGATSESVIATSTTDKLKYSSVTATYDFGVAKVGYSTTKSSSTAKTLGLTLAAAYEDDFNSYNGQSTSVTVPVTTALSVYYNTNTLKAQDSTSTANATVKVKGTQLGANYSLSKRTTVYLQTGKASYDGSTAATSAYAIGLLHGF